jgi:hypothetical protein
MLLSNREIPPVRAKLSDSLKAMDRMIPVSVKSGSEIGAIIIRHAATCPCRTPGATVKIGFVVFLQASVNK